MEEIYFIATRDIGIQKDNLIGRKGSYFYDTNFEYTLSDDHYYITKYIGTDTNVVVVDKDINKYLIGTKR